MADLGVWLAFKLEGLLYGICITIGILFGSYLLGGIWGSVWASMINNELYLLLDGATELRDRVVSGAVLSWGVFFCVAMLLYFLYFHGNSFRCHALCAAITVICGISVVVVWILTLNSVTKEQRDRVRTSFIKLLASNTEIIAMNWLSEQKCITISDCSDAIEKYLNARGSVGRTMNIIILVLFAIGFVGIAIVLALMAAIKPVNRDSIDGQSEEDVEIGNSEENSKHDQESIKNRRRESEIL